MSNIEIKYFIPFEKLTFRSSNYFEFGNDIINKPISLINEPIYTIIRNGDIFTEMYLLLSKDKIKK